MATAVGSQGNVGACMSLVVRCDSCRKAFRLDDKFAGKKVRCKACGGVITVPHAAGAAAGTAPMAMGLNDLDSLLAMEESAAPVETDEPVRRYARRAAPAAVAQVAPASANDGLAPAAYAQRK